MKARMLSHSPAALTLNTDTLMEGKSPGKARLLDGTDLLQEAKEVYSGSNSPQSAIKLLNNDEIVHMARRAMGLGPIEMDSAPSDETTTPILTSLPPQEEANPGNTTEPPRLVDSPHIPSMEPDSADGLDSDEPLEKKRRRRSVSPPGRARKLDGEALRYEAESLAQKEYFPNHLQQDPPLHESPLSESQKNQGGSKRRSLRDERSLKGGLGPPGEETAREAEVRREEGKTSEEGVTLQDEFRHVMINLKKEAIETMNQTDSQASPVQGQVLRPEASVEVGGEGGPSESLHNMVDEAMHNMLQQTTVSSGHVHVHAHSNQVSSLPSSSLPWEERNRYERERSLSPSEITVSRAIEAVSQEIKHTLSEMKKRMAVLESSDQWKREVVTSGSWSIDGPMAVIRQEIQELSQLLTVRDSQLKVLEQGGPIQCKRSLILTPKP